jgi:lysylphosphatidylglycerol synthetase-like protein (DUF2156 family)
MLNFRAWPLQDLCFAGMEAAQVREGYELWRPNREKASSKSMKAIVTLVLLASAALILIITLGGWERLQGGSVAVMSLVYAALYVLFAVLVFNWNRGLLPVAASLAIILAIFAALAAPAWFDRSKDGLDSPALPEDLLGLLCIVLVGVQLLLIAVALIAFNQNWHVEEERPIGGAPLAGEDDDTMLEPPAAPA